MSQLRVLTLLIFLVSCGNFAPYRDLLPLSKFNSEEEMLLTETEEAEYRYLADLYGLSNEDLNIRGEQAQVATTPRDKEMERIDLNEIENSSFTINDYEVTFVEDKFKHEQQLVAEAKAEELERRQNSRGIASIPEVSEVHKKHRPVSLFALAKKSTPESIRYFVKKKTPDLNKKNNQGDTPLHIAIKNKRFENVRTLISLNADPNIPDASGKSVKDYAKDMQLKSVLKLINRK